MFVGIYKYRKVLKRTVTFDVQRQQSRGFMRKQGQKVFIPTGGKSVRLRETVVKRACIVFFLINFAYEQNLSKNDPQK